LGDSQAWRAEPGKRSLMLTMGPSGFRSDHFAFTQFRTENRCALFLELL